MPLIKVYNTNLVTDDHSRSTTVWHVAALELITRALMRFIVIAKLSAVEYEFRDLRMGHRCCNVIIPLSSAVRCHVHHYDFAQSVSGCLFDPVAAYLAYRPSAKMDWSYLHLSDCWFLFTFCHGQIHQKPAADVTSHKCTASGKLVLPQMLSAHVDTCVVQD